MPEGVVAVYDTALTLVTVVPPSVEEAPAVEAPVAVVEGAEAPAAAAAAAPAPEEKKEEGSES
jgi:hypothetical protein